VALGGVQLPPDLPNGWVLKLIDTYVTALTKLNPPNIRREIYDVLAAH